MSSSLVQVKTEPQIKEEKVEVPLQSPEHSDGSTLTLHGLGSSCVHRKEYAEFPHLPVCQEEVSPEQEERNSSLVQEEPEPSQIKEEQEEEELLQRPEEAAGSTQTLLAVKSEDNDSRETEPVASTSTKTLLAVKSEDIDSRDTEPVASTSTEHKETQAYIEYCVPSQAASDDQLLSSHGSESDLTDDSDDWEETRVGQTALNKMNPRETDSKSPPASSRTENQSFSCTECGKFFVYKCHLKRHMRTHTGEKPFSCTECSQVFAYRIQLKRHMSTHTGEKLQTCTLCGVVFVYMCHLKEHMRVHTGEKPFTCSECGKLFGYMSHLKRHMSTHPSVHPSSTAYP